MLFQHPDIVEAAVYGIPHPDLGEEVAADVVLCQDSATTEAEIRRFVKDCIAPYKYPRVVRFIDQLPKSHTGKVLKRELRKKWKENPNPLKGETP